MLSTPASEYSPASVNNPSVRRRKIGVHSELRYIEFRYIEQPIPTEDLETTPIDRLAN